MIQKNNFRFLNFNFLLILIIIFNILIIQITIDPLLLKVLHGSIDGNKLFKKGAVYDLWLY